MPKVTEISSTILDETVVLKPRELSSVAVETILNPNFPLRPKNMGQISNSLCGSLSERLIQKKKSPIVSILNFTSA